ncbi:MAG: phage tail protein [Phycisphaerae bacterium]
MQADRCRLGGDSSVDAAHSQESNRVPSERSKWRLILSKNWILGATALSVVMGVFGVRLMGQFPPLPPEPPRPFEPTLRRVLPIPVPQPAIVGEVRLWAGALKSTPDGWLLCDGRQVNRDDYPELNGVIGVIFGAGASGDTIRLPNLRPLRNDDGDGEHARAAAVRFMIRVRP